MEHKIETIVTLPSGRKAEVVEGFCQDCAVGKSGIIACIKWRERGLIGECLEERRTDHKDVIYKEIKED